MKRISLVISALIILPGCAALFDPAVEKAAEAIVKYCDAEPAVNREAYRAAINNELPDGYSVSITCPSDLPE